MNLKRSLEARVKEMGLSPELVRDMHEDIADLIQGKGTLIVRRMPCDGALRPTTVWFYPDTGIRHFVRIRPSCGEK